MHENLLYLCNGNQSSDSLQLTLYFAILLSCATFEGEAEVEAQKAAEELFQGTAPVK